MKRFEPTPFGAIPTEMSGRAGLRLYEDHDEEKIYCFESRCNHQLGRES